jgi:eukaryotic-like serine/threonine-protein kinase
VTPERWRRVTGIFHEALPRQGDERAAFVAAQCGDDAALRREVEAMLAAHQELGPFSGPAPTVGPALAPGVMLGAYEVVSLLGTGGMGEVYLARDTALGRNVALKVLPPQLATDTERLARFEREARLLASVNHPNIAVIHGLERADGRVALVLEYVTGTTLADRLSVGTGTPGPSRRDSGSTRVAHATGQSTALPIDQVIVLARAIAEALAAAHRAGVMHRDLKPSNVMVTRSGAKLLDFGVAKVVERTGAGASAATSTLTARGLAIGTVPYMAPEQLRGAAVDHRCDIFSFGVVLYEMVTGQHPFASATAADTMAAILDRTPAPLAALRDGAPPRLARLVQKCLQKDPEDRWQSASDIVEALEWVHEDLRYPSATVRLGDSVAAGPQRVSLVGRALIGAGIMIAIGVGVVALLPSRPDTQADMTPLEFVIPPAPDTSWGTVPVAPNPAVSPNGRYVAVFAQAGGAPGIWLHDLQSGDARQLLRAPDGTAEFPFWAPDSSTLAVCGRDGVRTVGLDNRPPELVKAPSCSTGAWHATSGWLLSTDAGIVRMSPGGGTPEPVTTVNAARGELRHIFSRWLPDGRHFVFLVRAQTPEQRGIYLGFLDKTPPKRLLRESTNPVYVTENSGRGLLLYVRGSTLVAQRFDEGRLTLLPDVYPLGQRVRLGITARASGFDASDRLLVFRSGGGYQPTRLIWLDRAGRQIGEVGPDEAYRMAPSLSPDERTLLYGRFNEDTNVLEVWTTDLERGVSAPMLKSSEASLEGPLWSPNGGLLAYLSAERGVYVPWLLTVTGERRPLAALTGAATTPLDVGSTGIGVDMEWTPDSKYLLRRVNGGVRGFAVDGSHRTVTVLDRDVVTRVSPDGRWIAYEANDTGRREVYVERFGGGSQRRVSVDGGFSPQWRSDGTELFFRAAPDRMMAVDVRLGDTLKIGQPYALFRAPFEASGIATAGASDYVVTRDAHRFLITVPVVSVKPLTARLNWRGRLRRDGS